MTTSAHPSDVHHCFEYGAAGYMLKPVNLDKYVNSVESILKYWFEIMTLPAKVETQMTFGQGNVLPTILVVDDSPHDYETYVRYLNKARPNVYRTKFLSVGQHVFSSLGERPHCLLLDLSLPDMSGLDILRKLKEEKNL
jgi:CheY-like chemotaxis protein